MSENGRLLPDNVRRKDEPSLSIVVIVYHMARQAENTLFTLSPRYQREVDEADYEVIVVENASDWTLDEQRVQALGKNFRYFLREEQSKSPAAAINFGMSQCRARFIGLMIDGARMVTPRLVRYVLDAFLITENALVVVPGYHLGSVEQHQHSTDAYDEEIEQAMLADIDWRKDGYQLFSVACFSNSNPNGFFHPMMESNCMFASARNFSGIGGADERFQHPGGGALALHMFRALGLLPSTRYFMLLGEGSFHQFHRGVTTTPSTSREADVARYREELQEIWNHEFHSLRREAILLGPVTGWTMRFVAESAKRGTKRFKRLRASGKPEWPDEP